MSTTACPACGAASGTSDWCDQCGAALGRASAMPPAASPADRPCPGCGGLVPAPDRYCESCGYDLVEGRAPAPAPVVAWELVVVADQAQYDQVEDPGKPFPAGQPERRFVLAEEEVEVGRRSASRGIEPDVDVSEDPGVSHRHLRLVRNAEGWSVVDDGSTNGTRMGDDPNPIPPGVATPLAPGTPVRIGAWTRLDLRRT